MSEEIEEAEPHLSSPSSATCSSPAAVIIEKRVTRYSCPHCGRSRSKRKAVADHMFSCWKNPAAKSCGSCEHHLPPEKGERACWLSGYPGSPDHPRSCDVGVDNAEAMPRQCVRWAAESTDASLHQITGANGGMAMPLSRSLNNPKKAT